VKRCPISRRSISALGDAALRATAANILFVGEAPCTRLALTLLPPRVAGYHEPCGPIQRSA